MKTVKLNKRPYEPQSIAVYHTEKNNVGKIEEVRIATVYCDGIIRLHEAEISISELNDIKTVSENFRLFYDNMVQTEKVNWRAIN